MPQRWLISTSGTMLPMVRPPPKAHRLPTFSSERTVPMAIIKALSTSRRVFWFFIQFSSKKMRSSLMDDPAKKQRKSSALVNAPSAGMIRIR